MKPRTRLEVARWCEQEWCVGLYVRGTRVAGRLENQDNQWRWPKGRAINQAKRWAKALGGIPVVVLPKDEP